MVDTAAVRREFSGHGNRDAVPLIEAVAGGLPPAWLAALADGYRPPGVGEWVMWECGAHRHTDRQ